MLALIIILLLVGLGALWWWVVRPEPAALPRDAQLPLFSVRTPGRGVRILNESLALDDSAAGAPAPSVGSAPPPARSAWGGGATVPHPAAAGAAPAPGAATAAPMPPPDYAPSPQSSRVTAAGLPGRNGRSERSADRDASHAEPTAPASTTVAGNGSAATTDAERWAPPSTTPTPAGTVQFLPGRLEVVQGRSVTGQEVRFVRPERVGDRAVVTFGRGEGVPYRHVQLKVPTVSRLHARMSLEPGSRTWKLENLSTTNPVAVNGVDLPEGAPPLPLADGDRVEMGEVVFTYRAR